MQEQKQKNEVGRGLNDGSTSVSTKNARPRDARRARQLHSSEVKQTHSLFHSAGTVDDVAVVAEKNDPILVAKRCVVGDGK